MENLIHIKFWPASHEVHNIKATDIFGIEYGQYVGSYWKVDQVVSNEVEEELWGLCFKFLLPKVFPQ